MKKTTRPTTTAIAPARSAYFSRRWSMGQRPLMEGSTPRGRPTRRMPPGSRPPLPILEPPSPRCPVDEGEHLGDGHEQVFRDHLAELDLGVEHSRERCGVHGRDTRP